MLISDKIQRAIEGGQFSCGIFLDLSKAFDSVDHNIFLAKLYSHGIHVIVYEWFASYLTNRVQFFSIGNTTSTSTSVTCGVPQGSVLGSLLFLLYMILIIALIYFLFTFLRLTQIYFLQVHLWNS